jgi:predicted alpha/beta-fold hydrolase
LSTVSITAPWTTEEYLPSWWLRNPHVQSIVPTLPPQSLFTRLRAAGLLARAEAHVIDCGDDVRLLGFYSRHPNTSASRRLVVLLHGWEGSVESNYVLSLGAELFAQGCDVFRLNFRDHGASHHLNRELFHSCRLAEVVGAVKRIQHLFEPQELCLAGFSLGGNFSLRVAAQAPRAGIKLRRVVAVCPVVKPQRTMEVLRRTSIYSRYFIRKWKRSLALKQRSFPDAYDFRDLQTLDDLHAMTDVLVRKYSDFADIDAYLTGYSLVHGALASLEIPVHVIASVDDPIIPAEDWAELARVPNVTLELARYGGHCGFMRGFARPSWVDETASKVLLS